MAAPRPISIIPRVNMPGRTFKNHEGFIQAIATTSLMEEQCMVTTSADTAVCLWNLRRGVLLKKMKEHHEWVRAVAVRQFGDRLCMASGDDNGELIIWDGSLTGWAIDAHSSWIYSLDFSPDGGMLASGSEDKTMKLWSTSTWQLQGNPIDCGAPVKSVRYSPNSGEFIAVGTNLGIQIYSASSGECVAKMIHLAPVLSWMPIGTRLFSGGHYPDCTIREWDSSTWLQVGDPWNGHTNDVTAIAVNPNGNLVASASEDKHVRLWQLSGSDRQTIMIFEHSDRPRSIVFSLDGNHILGGGDDKTISEWEIPRDSAPNKPHGEQDHSENDEKTISEEDVIVTQ